VKEISTGKLLKMNPKVNFNVMRQRLVMRGKGDKE
jgi:hypothetical protein